MMHKLLFMLTALVLSITASAIEVENVAGTLRDRVEDTSVSSLTVTGEMDARDFKFIADSLRQLTEIDLSGVNIVAYYNALHPVFTTLNDYAAQSIPAMAFFDMQALNRVVLPASLKSIGMAAFAACGQLQSIELPASVDTIGSFAFSASGLTSVEVPASVLYVGEGAFAQCKSLEQATVSAAVIDKDAFKADDALATVTLGATVTSLGAGVFNGCYALTAIDLPEQSALATLGDEAFIRSGLTTMNFNGATQLNKVGEWAFAQSSLMQLSVPACVNEVGQGAFFCAPSLTALSLPEGLTEVPAYMLAGTQGLALDSLGEGVTTIGDYAFYNNSQATSFYLPSTVTYLGTKAMAGMTGLQIITSMATDVPLLGDSVWAGVNQPLVKLGTASNEVADLYAEADQWKEFYILHDYLLGDVNEDGSIDVNDVTTLINYILGKNPPVFNPIAANVNGDEGINVNDVTAIINLILSGETPHIQGTKAVIVRPVTTDHLSIEPFSVKPGECVTVQAKLADTQRYMAMQFEMALPEGLTLVEGAMRAGERARSHAIVSRMNERDNTATVIIYSPDNRLIDNAGETLFTFELQADNRLAGNAAIETRNTLLVNADNNVYQGSDAVTAVGNTTGVDDITAATDRVYAHAGVLVIESGDNGVAQLVATNGVYTELTVAGGRNEYDVASGIYIVRLNGKSYKVIVK